MQTDKESLGAFTAEVIQKSTTWTELQGDEVLATCYQNNPAAKILPLLKMLAMPNSSSATEVSMPMSLGTSLKLSARA